MGLKGFWNVGLEGAWAWLRQCQHSRSTFVAEPNPGRATRCHLGGACCRWPPQCQHVKSVWASRHTGEAHVFSCTHNCHVTGYPKSLCAVRGEERSGDSAVGRHVTVSTLRPARHSCFGSGLARCCRHSRPVATCITRVLRPGHLSAYPRRRLPGLHLRGGRVVPSRVCPLVSASGTA